MADPLLNSAQRSNQSSILDRMFDTNKKYCKIYYPPVLVDCSCNFSNIGKKPNSAWTHGGPVPVPGNLACPLCGGTGKRAEEITENIEMVINFDFRLSIKGNNINISNIALDFGYIQTRIKIADVPKIRNCEKLQVDLPNEAFQKAFYKPYKSPSDDFAVTTQKYVISYWERIS